MIRKLSVASITSNFTKRSGNAVSPQATTVPASEDNSDGKAAIPDNGASSPVLSKVPETTAGNNQTTATINDLDLQFDTLFDEKMTSLTTPPVNDSSPIGTMKRLAALRVKNVLQPEKNRRPVSSPITPRKVSLGRKTMARAASGGSIGYRSASPLSEISRESENQTPVKPV
jgi:hypothetical protein